jgi:hypothetical protein
LQRNDGAVRRLVRDVPGQLQVRFAVNPGDAIESAVHYLGNAKYELSLKDVTTGKGFDVVRACPASACENSSAETITEAYYYNKRYAGTSDFGDEHYEDVTVTDSAGNVGGLFAPQGRGTPGPLDGRRHRPSARSTATSTPRHGPLATATRAGLGLLDAFSVFWSREN